MWMVTFESCLVTSDFCTKRGVQDKRLSKPWSAGLCSAVGSDQLTRLLRVEHLDNALMTQMHQSLNDLL